MSLQPDSGGTIEIGDFVLDVERRGLYKNGTRVPLGSKAFDLLHCLVEKSGEVVTKDEILDSVWAGLTVEEANIPVQIAAIRRVLGETSREPRYIITIPGVGYKFSNEHRGTSEQENSTAPRFTENTHILRRWAFQGKLAIAAVLIIFIVIVIFKFVLRETERSDRAAKPQMLGATLEGKVRLATISPDGRLIAFVAGGEQGEWLAIRQIAGGSELKITNPQVQAEFWGLEFSKDGDALYYTLFSPPKADLETFRISTLGGVPERVRNVSSPSVAFSPAEDRIAFLISDTVAGKRSIATARPDGSDKKIVNTLYFPDTFLFAGGAFDWSPDGKKIVAVTLRNAGRFVQHCLTIYSVVDGSVAEPCLGNFQDVHSVTWAGTDEFIVVGKIASNRKSEAYVLSIISGATRKVEVGTGEPIWASSDADGELIIIILRNNFSSIRVIDNPNENDLGHEILKENGPIPLISWAGISRIIYGSEKSGRPELWLADIKTLQNRQITLDSDLSDRGLCFDDVLETAFYVGKSGGDTSLWMLDPDSGISTKITSGPADGYPSCAGNGSTFVFQSGIYSNYEIRSLSLSAADRSTVRESPLITSGKWPTISNDGRFIAFLQLSNENWLLKVRNLANGDETSRLTPPNQVGSKMQFGSSAKNIYYIGMAGGSANVWSLSLDDGTISPVTFFRESSVIDFSVSPLSGRVAVSLDAGTKDVVLLNRRLEN